MNKHITICPDRTISSVFKSPLSSFINEFFIDTLPMRGNSFPKYNLIKLGQDGFCIEMALAGYSKDELSVYKESNDLIVKGTKADTDAVEYLLKEVSTKDFYWKLKLPAHTDVAEVNFIDGMLRIALYVKTPDHEKIEYTINNS